MCGLSPDNQKYTAPHAPPKKAASKAALRKHRLDISSVLPERVRVKLDVSLAYIYRKPSSPKLRIQLHELIDGLIGDHSVGDIAVNFRIIKLGGGFGVLAVLLFEHADLLQ